MNNKVFLTGKVLNCYIHDTTGAFIIKLAVRHEHVIGKQTTSVESVFNTIMLDDNKIKNVDVMAGDTVNLTGYLKMDYKTSSGGNEHQKLVVYVTDIEVVKRKN